MKPPKELTPEQLTDWKAMRNAYTRAYRAKYPEKRRAWNENYWEKKRQQTLAELGGGRA